MKDVERFLRVIGLVSAPIEAYLFGPLEDAKYWASCQAYVTSLPENVTFTYGGEVKSADVAELFRRADLQLFPTRGEGFGHSIAEALAVGCPVLTTPFTIWTDVLTSGAGGVFTSDAEAAAWIDALAKMSTDARNADRQRAWELYTTWRTEAGAVGSLFSAAMELVDGQSPPPSS